MTAALDRSKTAGEPAFYRLSLPIMLACVVAVVAAAYAFRDGAVNMLAVWGGKEEYSHAYLIPVISLFLVWQRRNELAQLQLRGSWAGVVIVLFGVLLGLIGQLATVYTVQQIGLVVAICGFV